MKIAVTAANGKLGSTVIKQLIKNVGVGNIAGIARSPEKAAHLGVEIRKGDYDLEEDFNEALKGIDVLLMISGLADPDTRVAQHRKIIRAAQKNGVEKIVYTGILGDPEKTGFAPVVKSMRQTEEDVKNAGINWIVGRNGMYIEADLNYVSEYEKLGEISNSGGEGKSSYTSYPELARAYVKLLTDNTFNNQSYQLVGEPLSQSQLTDLINHHFDTDLKYKPISASVFYEQKIPAYGEFFGNIVGGIYEGISLGLYVVDSDIEAILGRPHKSPQELIAEFKKSVN